jgi:hypothetical protein
LKIGGANGGTKQAMCCLSGRDLVCAFTAGRRFALTCGYETFAFQAIR